MSRIVFSYQGAFGPPTYGHYKSMETFIEEITKDYGYDKTYTFLFMPTKKSSSKPHLEGTMVQREKILEKFCEKLRKKYPDVTIAPSRIEFDKHTPSDTINTIDVLTREYGDSTIILGMGKDNALQLPYWARIGEYKDNVESIYLVNREVGGETRVFENKEGDLIGTFDAKVPKWAAKDERLGPVFKKEAADLKASDLVEGIIPDGTTIDIELPEIREINANIPPSSSSMIRHFISRIIKGAEEDREENKTKIKKLMFGNDFDEDKESDEIVVSVIEDYKTLYEKQTEEEEENKVKTSLDSSYDKQEDYNVEYDDYMDKISHNKERGGKSKINKSMKKKKRKTLKKKRKSKRRKSLKKKQRKTKRKGRK
jgi:nicotinic acid mononucleotide adenylyltransferase